MYYTLYDIFCVNDVISVRLYRAFSTLGILIYFCSLLCVIMMLNTTT